MKKTWSALALVAASGLALTGCSGGGAASGSQGDELEGLTGVIGAKDFAEQYVLAYITTELFNAHGADVEANIELVGSTNVRQALENDQFLGYWEYTGTGWITYLGETEPVQGAEEQYQAVAEADLDENGIAWLEPAPLNNTYAFAALTETAEELGVTTLSDVAALPEDQQTFCIESEFSTRDDGWPGLRDTYGFADNTAMLDTGVIYTATAAGDDCTFGEVFETDGRIPGLGLTVLEDDLEFFPNYQGSFTLKQTTLDEYPAIADVIGLVAPLLTTEVMQQLNSQVDVEGEDPQDVAIDWLTEQGLI
ncbi:glycine/betaine ABC transporter substrate-binding protein [Pseudoclavibacter endophyticus]|uniref:Glycine betaine ABC transporter substrate-binding protein n=1 Tax=Pseudoclavibacter endophyticus TaxID=1778590 RepID=A0A6H9WD34_9MICO|nr:glycine betaine ABC transporter substrate-binding protein [Pseudoclavibacter endophyticus]KAB1648809.1 glycine betaine ABC transporter substrate-binding protein [Pseudoclavibacter endophyticus]GGA68349.1 glycine/betaine ABC transporter substrate-binding protein [Pseudoclavibacter endophyticus]